MYILNYYLPLKRSQQQGQHISRAFKPKYTFKDFQGLAKWFENKDFEGLPGYTLFTVQNLQTTSNATHLSLEQSKWNFFSKAELVGFIVGMFWNSIAAPSIPSSPYLNWIIWLLEFLIVPS